MALCIVMVLGILAGCGQKGNDTPKNDDNSTALSGSVSTNGSTSMDKVIGALKEQFTADNPGVTVTYDPTGSGSGIEAVKNGTADIGLASRALAPDEEAQGLVGTTLALDELQEGECLHDFVGPLGVPTHVEDLEQYDTILLGYPNWWASIPMPVASFLEEYDFTGKTIVPFCTSGSSGIGGSLDELQTRSDPGSADEASHANFRS